jgi:hypothetical protein
MRLGGPQSRSGRVRKISPPTGIRSSDRPARSESLYRPEQNNSDMNEYNTFLGGNVALTFESRERYCTNRPLLN